MMNRLEDLWKSADEGAMAPIGPLNTPSKSEFDDLLDAWYLERRNSIESEILLDQSRSVLARLLAEADPDSPASKQARRLIRAIDRAARLAGSGGI